MLSLRYSALPKEDSWFCHGCICALVYSNSIVCVGSRQWRLRSHTLPLKDEALGCETTLSRNRFEYSSAHNLHWGRSRMSRSTALISYSVSYLRASSLPPQDAEIRDILERDASPETLPCCLRPLNLSLRDSQCGGSPGMAEHRIPASQGSYISVVANGTESQKLACRLCLGPWVIAVVHVGPGQIRQNIIKKLQSTLIDEIYCERIHKFALIFGHFWDTYNDVVRNLQPWERTCSI
jgi:hypothetical protein